MQTIDIKAKVRDRMSLFAKVELLTDTPCETIVQHDTFYNVTQGRLKLRQSQDNSQLIYYERNDDCNDGPKLKTYDFLTIESETVGIELNRLLTKALGEKGVVKKTRQVFTNGSNRIFIDSVDGLGDFVEIEVKLNVEQTAEDGDKIAYSLMEKLGIGKEDLVAGAYRDLLFGK